MTKSNYAPGANATRSFKSQTVEITVTAPATVIDKVDKSYVRVTPALLPFKTGMQ